MVCPIISWCTAYDTSTYVSNISKPIVPIICVQTDCPNDSWYVYGAKSLLSLIQSSSMLHDTLVHTRKDTAMAIANLAFFDIYNDFATIWWNISILLSFIFSKFHMLNGVVFGRSFCTFTYFFPKGNCAFLDIFFHIYFHLPAFFEL